MGQLFLLLFISFSFAQAESSLTINHPRNPSHQDDTYTVSCLKECDLKVSASTKRKGTSGLINFESKINHLISLASDDFPVVENVPTHQILYSIEAKSNDKKMNLNLGYPKRYLGKDYQKYSDLIVRIEEIKREIIIRTVDGK